VWLSFFIVVRLDLSSPPCCFFKQTKALGTGSLEEPVENKEVERVQEQENDADGVSTALGFTESLPPTARVVEVLHEQVDADDERDDDADDVVLDGQDKARSSHDEKDGCCWQF
jgi:hypothetical protein